MNAGHAERVASEFPVEQSSYLFVCGCPRSGTTALAAILNEHPSILVGIERFKHIAVGPRGREFGPELFEKGRFADIRPDDTNIYAPNQKLLSKLDGKRDILYIGDKVPRLYARLEFLRIRFPTARVIFLARDPKAVALSWGRRARDENDLWSSSNDEVKAFHEWQASIEAVNSALPSWGERLRIVHYDSFFGVSSSAEFSSKLSALYGTLGLRMLPDRLRKVSEKFFKGALQEARCDSAELARLGAEMRRNPAFLTLVAKAIP